jgi:hypothetical protein
MLFDHYYSTNQTFPSTWLDPSYTPRFFDGSSRLENRPVRRDSLKDHDVKNKNLNLKQQLVQTDHIPAMTNASRSGSTLLGKSTNSYAEGPPPSYAAGRAATPPSPYQGRYSAPACLPPPSSLPGLLRSRLSNPPGPPSSVRCRAGRNGESPDTKLRSCTRRRPQRSRPNVLHRL